jgi:hypothetical protein
MAEKTPVPNGTPQEEKIDTSPAATEFEDFAKTDTSDVVKKVDTVHHDEALKVLAQYHGDVTWTEKEEKHVLRKIDRALMPILCVTYGLQYYDKSMLGQAVSFDTTFQSIIYSLLLGSFWPPR